MVCSRRYSSEESRWPPSKEALCRQVRARDPANDWQGADGPRRNEGLGMKKIDGDAKTIRALLGGSKYSIDYYQREYRWGSKHVHELLEDVSSKFLEDYQEGHERTAVAEYGHYFLGSVIISEKDGQKFIIDGQQRLTSITLLLMHLYQLLDDNEQKTQLSELIFSQKYGKRSFNLDVEERTPCMEALYTGEAIELEEAPESVQNIAARFDDIAAAFPDELQGVTLPYFVDWLIENVHFVEITAYSDSDAYTIFETMNDRGLSLTPTEMLKGYLLANIGDTDLRSKASDLWRDRVGQLKGLGKEEDADAIKSWLRSQHAKSIRERRKGARPLDFDLIGTEFHRWVRDRATELGLASDATFFDFIRRDFGFYAGWYGRLREAAQTWSEDLECVHYNARHNFTLQYPVLLAPLRIDDSEEVVRRKIRITARYLDVLIHRRLWNWRSIAYSTMQYNMFTQVIRDIRGLGVEDLVDTLLSKLDEETETFLSNPRFTLTGTNRPRVHQFLARMTDYLERASGMPARYEEYAQSGTKGGYEVEHIWADRPERHTEEFVHPVDFAEYRNRIGGLLLLPKSFNASYGDKPYEEKLDHYHGQNLLAKSLHPRTYELNPGFKRFVTDSGLPFRAYEQFRKADQDARQELYAGLADLVWSPDRVAMEAER